MDQDRRKFDRSRLHHRVALYDSCRSVIWNPISTSNVALASADLTSGKATVNCERRCRPACACRNRRCAVFGGSVASSRLITEVAAPWAEARS